ncbi:hypothetical protein PISMIDRAFT_13396 [Pisolithus microcarpus 441]|uniref:Uncharacterized protein n=1 Tax=Pisolithus microcarpus 441 TaxID=765257 RepID=A0A0C9ZIM2_9AGAM|nr:hypothetical protein BKA83DRAFT_13396 [Pisolithus microcarpus]KIK19833.1 hypothetical protein PISMIDRAFT_13396 [Pisolithus microcarpus 441]
MRLLSADLLCDTAAECGLSMGLGPICLDKLMFWMEKQSLQLITLAVQSLCILLADIFLQELKPATHHKCEHLIMELVHQRDVTRTLIQQRVADPKAFTWFS